MQTFKFIAAAFFVWRIWLFVFLLFAVLFIPLRSSNFLGGGYNYFNAPWFWAWANFDGEHYLSIAQNGYGQSEQAFFPLYPLLIKLVGSILGGDIFAANFSGLLISHISFFLALLGLWKLIKLDFKENIATLSLVLLLLFPTSFYFGSVYTESLFLAFVVWSFYFARSGKWWEAGILGGLASATRFIGIFLLPVLLAEWWKNKRSKGYWDTRILGVLLVPIGLLAYMYYLWQTTGNPLAFWTTLPGFGEQRSAIPILLPQVFFRYAKILVTATWNDPLYYAIVMELITAILFLVLSIWSFFKTRLSYALFLTLGFLAPTFSGSFSSFPRYVLVLFPGFIILALWLSRWPAWAKVLLFGVLIILLGITTAMFVRGHWIA